MTFLCNKYRVERYSSWLKRTDSKSVRSGNRCLGSNPSRSVFRRNRISKLNTKEMAWLCDFYLYHIFYKISFLIINIIFFHKKLTRKLTQIIAKILRNSCLFFRPHFCARKKRSADIPTSLYCPSSIRPFPEHIYPEYLTWP